MNTDYEILGVSPEADESEIKKAYFRQIRKHPPEKDPEGFRLLREAYDRLKDTDPDEAGPAFPNFRTNMERRFAEQIEQCMVRQDFSRARDTAQEACNRFPGVLFFLYELVVAQRENGNTGKAVSNAKKLVALDPDNKWYQRELALSLARRGYHSKALPELEKAYVMGCRDTDFLIEYAWACFKQCDRETNQKMADRLLDQIRSRKRWKREDLESAAELFHSVEEIGYAYPLEDGFQKGFDIVCGFIRTYWRDFQEDKAEEWAEILDKSTFLLQHNHGNVVKMFEGFELLMKRAPSGMSRNNLMERREHCLFKLLEQDDRIGETVYRMVESILDDRPAFKRINDVDASLLLLEKPEEVRVQMPVIREDYPMLMKGMDPFLKLLELNDKERERKKFNLRQELKNFVDKGFIGGAFYGMYPQEKERDFGKQIASGEETYIRKNKKIGRNDPCPCGSGKKYKQCCMNKGIYE